MDPLSLGVLLTTIGGIAGIGAFGGKVPPDMSAEQVLNEFNNLTPEKKKEYVENSLKKLREAQAAAKDATVTSSSKDADLQKAKRALVELQSNFLTLRNKSSVLKRQLDDALTALKSKADKVVINFLDEELLLRVYLLDIITSFDAVNVLDFIRKLDVSSKVIESGNRKYTIKRTEDGCIRNITVRVKGNETVEKQQKEPSWDVILNRNIPLNELLPITPDAVGKTILKFMVTEQGAFTIEMEGVIMYVIENVQMTNLCRGSPYPKTISGNPMNVLSSIRYKPEVTIIKNKPVSQTQVPLDTTIGPTASAPPALVLGTQVPIPPLASGVTGPTGAVIGSTQIEVGSTCTGPTGTTVPTTGPVIGSTQIEVGPACSASGPTGPAPSPTGPAPSPTGPVTTVPIGSTAITIGPACSESTPPVVPTPPPVVPGPPVGSTQIEVGPACSTPGPTGPPPGGLTIREVTPSPTGPAPSPTGPAPSPTGPVSTTQAEDITPPQPTITPSSSTETTEPQPLTDLTEQEKKEIKINVARKTVASNNAFNQLVSKNIDIVRFLEQNPAGVKFKTEDIDAINNSTSLNPNEDPAVVNALPSIAVDLEDAVENLKQTALVKNTTCNDVLNLIADAFIMNGVIPEYYEQRNKDQLIDNEIKKSREGLDNLLFRYFLKRKTFINNVNPNDTIYVCKELEEERELKTLMNEITEQKKKSESLIPSLTPSASTESTESTESTTEPTSVQPTPQQDQTITNVPQQEATGEADTEDVNVEVQQGSIYQRLNDEDINILNVLGIDDINTTAAEVKDKFNTETAGFNFDAMSTQTTLTDRQRELVKIHNTGIMEDMTKLNAYLDELRENTPVRSILDLQTTPAPAPVTTTEEPSEQIVELGQKVIDATKTRRTTPTKKLRQKLKEKTGQYIVQRPTLPSTTTKRLTPTVNLPVEGIQPEFEVPVNPLYNKEQQNLALNQAVQETQPTAGPTTATAPLPEPTNPPPAVYNPQMKIDPKVLEGVQNYIAPQYPPGSRGARMQSAKRRTAQQGTPWRRGGSRKKTLRARRENTQNERRTRRSQNRPNRTHKNSRRRT